MRPSLVPLQRRSPQFGLKVPTGPATARLQLARGTRVKLADASKMFCFMTRPRQRSAGPNAVNPERKAIEDRAREASKPAGVEKKGRWPFTAGQAGAPDVASGERSYPVAPKDLSR